MSTQGENEKRRATVNQGERLEWQSELDTALSDIDSRLKHPRRRVSDTGPDAPFPALGQQVVFTTELLDEIAWRVSQQLRHHQPLVADALSEQAAPPAPPEPEIRPGVVMVIRFRWPLFRWPFRRRRRHKTMIQFSDYRIT